jgi:hypothetical protein
MVASIGPFWDANETWLVLADRPAAGGLPAGARHDPDGALPAGRVLLIGLILRGVAFEFRAKAPRAYKPRWNRAFFAGSLMASLSPGLHAGLCTSWAWSMDAWPTVGLRAPDGGVPDRGLQLHRRGLADHQDRGRAAAQGRALGARAASGAGAGGRRDLARLAPGLARGSSRSGSPSRDLPAGPAAAHVGALVVA